MSSLFRFGDLELDLVRYELRRDGRVLKLERIPMDLLIFLVQQRGRLVTREEIIQRIWGKDVFVDTENAVNTSIRKVRQALKDNPTEPQILETVPGKGYRFIAQVITPDPEPQVASPVSKSPAVSPDRRKPANRTRRWVLLTSLLAILLFVGLGIATRRDRSSQRITSLVVLPLEDLSDDPSQDYFTDGLTDELITDLAKLPGLRVISRTSAMLYKKTNKPLPQIARELNVDAVVEGTVLRTEHRVRIRVQLIEARQDRHLWAKAYERNLTDTLGLQSEVAGTVAHQIKIELTPQQVEGLSRDDPANFEAYAAYLKGRYEWNKRTPESLKQGIRYFEEAIAKDPNYALAHEGLAETYDVLASYDVMSPQEAYPKAKAEALRALELDSRLGEAYFMLADLRYLDWDWPGADEEFQRGLELSPGDATGREWHSEYLMNSGRRDESVAEMQRALELDPASPVMNAVMGATFYWARQYDKSTQQLEKAIEMEPRFAYSHAWLGLAYEQKGMQQQAMREFQKAADLSPGSPAFTAYLGYGYARSGNERQAVKMIEKLTTVAQSKQTYVSPLYVALVYAGLGNKAQASVWMEKGYASHDRFLVYVKTEPAFDSIRSDPRVQGLIRQMDLVPQPQD